ncbi:MAG: hypothetical protein ACREQP_17915 [Candidatus Binatia bacterium]
MDTVFEVLASAGFLEKALLLIVGAALTGIIVPVVKSRMDKRRFEQQKIFEADLARQAEIVKARAQFLRDLVDPIWQFQLLALQISYDSYSEEKFQGALAKYDEHSWQHLMRIRAIVGGARWFTSEPAYHALTEFVDGWLIHEIDMELMKRRRSGKAADWTDFNQWLYSESRNRTDALLVILAEDFGLAPAASARKA